MNSKRYFYGKVAAKWTAAVAMDISLANLEEEFRKRGLIRAARATRRQRLLHGKVLRRAEKDIIRMNKKIARRLELDLLRAAKKDSVAGGGNFRPNLIGRATRGKGQKQKERGANGPPTVEY